MPTYTYQCRLCQKVHEDFQSMSNRKVWYPCECGGISDQVIDIPGRAIGVEERSDTRYWRDAPTRIFMNDKRKRKT